MLLCRTWPLRCKQAEPGREPIAAESRRATALQRLQCPTAAQATIVLPVFTRSCRADKEYSLKSGVLSSKS